MSGEHSLTACALCGKRLTGDESALAINQRPNQSVSKPPHFCGYQHKMQWLAKNKPEKPDATRLGDIIQDTFGASFNKATQGKTHGKKET